MRNIYSYLFKAIEERRRIALATIVETKGSAPQIPGVSALFSREGLVTGTLGGGLLEGDAQKKAAHALEGEKPELYGFNLQDDISSEEGAICGGVVKILIDPSPEKDRVAFRRLHKSITERNAGVLATSIKRFHRDKISLSRTWVEKREIDEARIKSPYSIASEEINKVISEGKPVFLEMKGKGFTTRAEESFLFLEYIFPFPQLVIAGAGHVGQAVSHLGHLLDFEVTVIDDRAEFANSRRLPDADRIIVDYIGKAIRNFPVSRDTYVVIVTRGHHHDAEALRGCIGTDAAYIGMIGSRRKLGLMRKKFIEEEWATPKQFDRVYAPIGVDINSKTVQEIAVSIAAQLVLKRRQAQEKLSRG